MRKAPLHKKRHISQRRVDVSAGLSIRATVKGELEYEAEIEALAKLLGDKLARKYTRITCGGIASVPLRETRLTMIIGHRAASFNQWLKSKLASGDACRIKMSLPGELEAYRIDNAEGAPDYARIYESIVPMKSASSGHECPVGRRVNTGSKPSRERRHDDRPNANEVDRPEATTDPSPDAVERIPMPLGGVKERDRIAKHRD